MGFTNRVRSLFRPAVTESIVADESSAAVMAPPTAAQVRRVGYEYGIPLSSMSTSVQVAATSERQQILSQLHQLYMTCDWVSSSIDVVARTVTAGGLQVVANASITEGDIADDPPPVMRLKRLTSFTNPREDMIQLLRNVVIDLLLFGDAYLETVCLLGEPVALYALDATTMTVDADEHGEVRGYIQNVDGVRSANFGPDNIIHFSLDAPRGGLYGVSPAQKVQLPATAWLFVMATLKECFRRGDPPRIHVDLNHYSDTDVQRWREQYRVSNLGPKSVGEPLTTTGGGAVQVLDPRKVTDYLDAARQLRDEIICGFGVPPSKLGIIETGNLGGGTGEAQDKAVSLSTPIPTPSGWTTMGELRVGDQVLDEAGRPCNVVGTYEVPNADSWRLSFSDGTWIDCCSDHLWVTWTYKDRCAYGRSASRVGNAGLPENWPTWRSGRGLGPQIRRTAEVVGTLQAYRGRGNHSIPVSGALDLPEVKLPIDPYVLGAWLGDSTSTDGSITNAVVDEQIIGEIRTAGYDTVERPSVRRRRMTVACYNVLELKAQLKQAGILGDKHIPVAYLRASAAQRLALLQGLMDTDGGFSSGQQVLFRSTNERLADAVVELARSLGQKPVKAKGRAMLNGVDCGPQYGITWTPTIQVFRLARKVSKWAPRERAQMQLMHRMITGAVKIPNQPMRCIRVDSPNAMYLAGEAMIPTHNTFRVNTVIPVANLVLEKLNFHLLQQGFGIYDYHLEFSEIDFRDSKVVEEIRDMRLRNGSYSLNRYRDEIGEPPVPGGDLCILVDRQGVIAWEDMDAMSKSTVAYRAAPLTQAGVDGYVPGLPPSVLNDPGMKDVGKIPVPSIVPRDKRDPATEPGLHLDGIQGVPPKESAVARDQRRLSESWQAAYRARRATALRELPKVDVDA